MSRDILWAPWRSSFIFSKKKERGCIFCNRLKEKDSAENLVVYRGKLAAVILNKYPYNSGHSMIVPLKHVASLEKLRTDEAVEFFELTRLTAAVMKRALRPHSLNIGMNIGKASGAGIPGHIHMHIVPRWNGDTNFMPILGKTKVISVSLDLVYERLRREFNKG